jgi:prepilin-type processing-associated H-X9-DG protein
LLVVMAIVGILTGLMLPALTQARSQTRRVGCINNLRQIGLATLLYVDQEQAYPPAWSGPEQRWMDLLKPFLDKSSGVYLCPADQQRLAVTWDPTIHLSYGINVFRFDDRESSFWYGVRANRVVRPSGLILFADCTPGKYYCGGGGDFREPVVDVDYRHPRASFVAVFCDGHVETRIRTHRLEWDASQ